jgi:hypothetical protein
MPEESKPFTDFMIGADPEFLCVAGTSDVIKASEVCEDPDNGSIGADGNGVTFEARPEPSKNPLQVVSNIQRIFSLHVFDKPEFCDYNWMAGSYAFNYPLGGHIHFGLPDEEPKKASGILSQYLASLSLMIESKKEGMKRRDGEYGGPWDHRKQTYGFEYRTLSSWLSSPYVASAMLCLAKTVMFEKVNNPTFPFETFLTEDDFYDHNTERVEKVFPEIWKQITQMRLYQTYKPHIDVLYWMIQNKFSWFPKNSMREAWGIIDVSASFPKTQVTLETIWARYQQSTSAA